MPMDFGWFYPPGATLVDMNQALGSDENSFCEEHGEWLEDCFLCEQDAATEDADRRLAEHIGHKGLQGGL